MCIGIGIAFDCIVIVLAFGRGVHTVGHASPPLVDAASWRRSSAFSSARRLSSAVGSSAPSGSGSSTASSTLSSLSSSLYSSPSRGGSSRVVVDVTEAARVSSSPSWEGSSSVVVDTVLSGGDPSPPRTTSGTRSGPRSFPRIWPRSSQGRCRRDDGSGPNEVAAKHAIAATTKKH